MNPRWLLRMRRWAQHPPSTRRVLFVVAILAAAITLVLIERLIGWPDWLTLEPQRRGPGRY